MTRRRQSAAYAGKPLRGTDAMNDTTDTPRRCLHCRGWRFTVAGQCTAPDSPRHGQAVAALDGCEAFTPDAPAIGEITTTSEETPAATFP